MISEDEEDIEVIEPKILEEKFLLALPPPPTSTTASGVLEFNSPLPGSTLYFGVGSR